MKRVLAYIIIGTLSAAFAAFVVYALCFVVIPQALQIPLSAWPPAFGIAACAVLVVLLLRWALKTVERRGR